MFKFKMVDNDKCDICGEIESIRHVIWECNRAERVWMMVRSLLTYMNVQIDLSFESLFIGFNPTNLVIETIITRIPQLLLSYDRSALVSVQSIKNTINNFAYMNKFS